MVILTNTVLAPSCLVDKICKNEFGLLVRRGFGRDGDEDDKKGDERGVEGCSPYGREELSVAVEDEGECIDDLVANKDIPRVDCAADVRIGIHRAKERTNLGETGPNIQLQHSQRPKPRLQK